MAIPSRQIGWGTEENLLWQISKQLEYLTGVAYAAGSASSTTTTTTSTTTAAPSYSYNVNFAFGSGSDACNDPVSQPTVYSADATLVNGSYIYPNPDLTGGIADGYIAFGGNWYQIYGNQVIDIQSCNPTFSYYANYSTASAGGACYQAQDQFTIYTPVAIDTGVGVYTDSGLTTPAPDGYYSVNGTVYIVAGNNVSVVDSCPAADAYTYVISQTDLDAAIGNTNTSLNGKVITETSNDGSGNPATRSFSSVGSYNHWMCSLASITPTFGYWANNVFVTAGLVSTQTNIGAC